MVANASVTRMNGIARKGPVAARYLLFDDNMSSLLLMSDVSIKPG